MFETFILNLSSSNKLIIVEGKKDRKALESFSISNILELNKSSISNVVDFVSKGNSECIILTDLDREGKKIYGKLKTGLERNGVKIDNTFRNFLYRNTKLRNIEGLRRYFERAKEI